MAGLRPGLGRGGTIHSLLVRVVGDPAEVGAGDDAAGRGFMHSDGLRDRAGMLGALLSGDPAVVEAGEPALAAMMVNVFGSCHGVMGFCRAVGLVKQDRVRR